MVKNVNVNELLFSDLLVKEPVRETNDSLTGNEKRGKLILTGSRGCGKSTVLASRENDSLKTTNPAVLTRFDGAGLFSTKENKYFNKRVMEHYYEVVMCKKFLDHIKEFYPELFYKRFSNLSAILGNKVHELDNYINDAIYRDLSIDHKLFSGEMLSEIVSLFRQGVGAESLTLMIDRFDWTHNSDSRVQEILNNYFSMFEKVIITSDDPTLITDKKKVSGLKEKGFDIRVVDYASDLDTVRDIVERRFELDDVQPRFPVEQLTDEDYLGLMERCGGNLNLILESFIYAEGLHKWDSKKDIHTVLDEASRQKLKDEKQYRKMVKPPKFHL